MLLIDAQISYDVSPQGLKVCLSFHFSCPQTVNKKRMKRPLLKEWVVARSTKTAKKQIPQ